MTRGYYWGVNNLKRPVLMHCAQLAGEKHTHTAVTLCPADANATLKQTVEFNLPYIYNFVYTLYINLHAAFHFMQHRLLF